MEINITTILLTLTIGILFGIGISMITNYIRGINAEKKADKFL